MRTPLLLALGLLLACSGGSEDTDEPSETSSTTSTTTQACEDTDGDGVCDDVDVCVGDDATGDADMDGVCDDTDVCLGDDTTGDSDSDGTCDDTDACIGDDASGDTDADGVCDDGDLCIGEDAVGDTDGDGACDDTDPCPTDSPDDPDGDGVCGGWVFANYDGIVAPFDPALRYDGLVNCPTTCASAGLTAVGARFVCNQTALGGPEVTEGCDLTNVGEYGTDNCGWMVRDNVALSENGNDEDCANGIAQCVTGDCSEGVTYHALECQCE